MHTQKKNESNVSVERVPYMGREVIVRTYESDGRAGANISVVGFIKGGYMRLKEGTLVPVTDVEPIIDDEEIRSFTKMLREKGERVPINYWT